jgi:flagella basal body P-ring formation protein FlgA
MSKPISLLAAVLLILPVTLQAGPIKNRIVGRESIVTQSHRLRLRDVADITPADPSRSAESSAIGNIEIVPQLRPGEEKTVTAEEVLGRLRDGGIDLNENGYSLPQLIRVRRLGRVLEAAEVKSALLDAYSRTGRKALVKSIHFSEPAWIPQGQVTLRADLADTAGGANAPFSLSALAGEEVFTYQLSANVEEWGDVPVAARAMRRGDTVQPSDVRLEKANLSSLPRGSALRIEDVLGMELTATVGAGNVFSGDRLTPPSAVKSGQKIVIMYRKDGIVLTATGTALQSGVVGSVIKVRNSSSNKQLEGTVLNADYVEVK